MMRVSDPTPSVAENRRALDDTKGPTQGYGLDLRELRLITRRTEIHVRMRFNNKSLKNRVLSHLIGDNPALLVVAI
jgi:hypothetical protein